MLLRKYRIKLERLHSRSAFLPGMAYAMYALLSIVTALVTTPADVNSLTRTLVRPLRTSCPKACSSDDLEAKLAAAIEEEDYKTAAILKAQIDEAALSEPVPVKELYESLQRRTSQLSSRRDTIMRERKLIKDLAAGWPASELAQQSLWDHWFGEYGEEAKSALLAAEGESDQLSQLIDEYPDWIEPANRLATLRYLEGEYDMSVALCLKILQQKPWHFGAASGIVMCYAKLGETAKAKHWSMWMMPASGPAREEWVERNVERIDAKLEELGEIVG